jgi:hypothetical protein
MEITQKVNLHNRFDVEVRDAKTGELKKQAYAENIILTALWTRMISSTSGYFNRIHLGTGTGTLSAARTSLFTFLSSRTVSNPTNVIDRENGFVSSRRSVTYAENELVGSIITEVGIAYGDTSTNLVTHALLKDMNGNQVSLLKTDTDIITIYATVYLVFSASGWDSGHIRLIPLDDAITDRGTSTPASIIARILGDSWTASNTRCDFNQFRYLPTSGGIAPTITYDVANKRITFYTRLPAGSENGDGIYSILLGQSILFDVMGSTSFPGSSIIGEQIGVGDGTTQDFKTAFGHVKTGAKIYVDGVEQTIGVTVDLSKPGAANISSEFIIHYQNSYLFGVETAIGASSPSGLTVEFENPYYAIYGIDSFYSNRGSLYVSDDRITWDLLDTYTSTGTRTITGSNRNKRYWKFVEDSTFDHRLNQFVSNDLTAAALKNVHFATPPASGAVITIDYDTELVAKDANHVFDCTFVLQFGEVT